MEARLIRGVATAAYSANVTGLSAMVAYSATLALLPLTLAALFFVSTLLDSASVQASLLADLERIVPSATRASLEASLTNVRNATSAFGLGALISGIWIGISFWSALDTAFCRIYDAPCRSWPEQKRFAAAMVVVGLFLVLAAVGSPVLHSIVSGGTADLPFGLAGTGAWAVALALILGHGLLFTTLCVVFRSVPNFGVPWRAIWPGALLATGLIWAVSYVFPLYLSRTSTLAHAGAAFAFVMVTLIWFYLMSLALLLGATLNAVRLRILAGGE